MSMEDKLPFELWLEILSYLPRGFHRRLIAVNRALFEFALDEIYKEIELVRDDERTLFTFSQLQNADIAKRVQRLVIRPTFLPDEGAIPLQFRETKPPEKSSRRFNWFTKSKRSSYITQDQLYDESEPKTSDILCSTAQRNIAFCSNIRDLKIDLNVRNSQITSCFEFFFQSLWQPGSLLSRIRKLTIDATPFDLAQLILPMYQSSHLWANLEYLDLTIHPYHGSSDLNHVLLSTMFAGLKDSLKSFILSGHMDPYIAQVLDACPHFSRLSTFELHSIFNVQDLGQVQQLNLFLETHSQTLQNFVVNPQIRTASINASNYSYIHWLASSGIDQARKQTFSEISLPLLRNLEIRYDHRWINGAIFHPFVFPDLNFIAPNLTALAVVDTELSLDRILELLPLLPHRSGVCSLESLSLSIDILSPELLDLLSDTLVDLSSLQLRLSRYLLRSDLEQYIFYKVIQQRKYPAWKLQHISIVSPSACGTPHPNIMAMTAVATTLSTPPTIDAVYNCQCRTPY